MKQDYLYYKDPDIQDLSDESTDEKSKRRNTRRTRQVKRRNKPKVLTQNRPNEEKISKSFKY